MKRYFYRDPLAAAWMTRHHELRIGLIEPANRVVGIASSPNAVFTGGDQFIDMLCLDLLRWEMEDNADYKFYIHPDSLPLLEPREGDLLTSGETIRNSIAVATITDLERCGVGIIQRDSKPFHWPEVEE